MRFVVRCVLSVWPAVMTLCSAVPVMGQLKGAGNPPVPDDRPTPLWAFDSSVERQREGTLFGSRRVEGDVAIVGWDAETARAASRDGRRMLVSDFPLGADLWVDLELEPFSVTRLDTRFVLGRKDGPDRPMNFDPSRISLFRGQVAGRAGSHVFLALSDQESTGVVDLGLGAGRFRVSSRGGQGRTLGPGQLSVFEAAGAGGGPPGVPFCGTADQEASVSDPLSGLAPKAGLGTEPIRSLQHLELAVETDHEYFQLFDSSEAAATYLVEMYGQISDVYIRDVNTRVELVFARIWDDPDDLFNDVDPSPLSDFQIYWNGNMGAVQRDVAQLFSGRRDYPFGGQAFLSSLCGGAAYSVVGYATGFFRTRRCPAPSIMTSVSVLTRSAIMPAPVTPTRRRTISTRVTTRTRHRTAGRS